MRGVHLVGLSFPDGVPRDLLGVERICDLHEEAPIGERTRGEPVVRAGALKEDGIESADAFRLKMDNEFPESDTGVGKGGCDCRFAISIPDACNQLPLPNVNANRLIHGVVVSYSTVKERREKRRKKPTRRPVRVRRSKRNQQLAFGVSTERYSSGEARSFGGWDRLRFHYRPSNSRIQADAEGDTPLGWTTTSDDRMHEAPYCIWICIQTAHIPFM